MNVAAQHASNNVWHTHRISRPRDVGSDIAAYKEAQAALWNAAGAAADDDHTELLRPLYGHISYIVEQRLGKSSDGAILDIASGTGEPSLSIARALPACSVIATDAASSMVDRARNRAAEECLNIFRCTCPVFTL